MAKHISEFSSAEDAIRAMQQDEETITNDFVNYYMYPDDDDSVYWYDAADHHMPYVITIDSFVERYWGSSTCDMLKN